MDTRQLITLVVLVVAVILVGAIARRAQTVQPAAADDPISARPDRSTPARRAGRAQQP